LRALNPDSQRAFREAAASSGNPTVLSALDHATSWYTQTSDPSELEAGARRFALTLGRTMELALLIKCSAATARRFAASGVDLIFAEERTIP